MFLNKLLINTCCIFLLAFLISSCKKDEDREAVCEDGSTPTYDSEMKVLVDANCTSSGCHNSGSANGDFTSYSGMSSDINSGKIDTRVLERQDMPRNATLSQAELNKFKCWAENNFAEN